MMADHKETVELLLKYRPDVICFSDDNCHKMIEERKKPYVKMLLEHGANVNIINLNNMNSRPPLEILKLWNYSLNMEQM